MPRNLCACGCSGGPVPCTCPGATAVTFDTVTICGATMPSEILTQYSGACDYAISGSPPVWQPSPTNSVAEIGNGGFTYYFSPFVILNVNDAPICVWVATIVFANGDNHLTAYYWTAQYQKTTGATPSGIYTFVSQTNETAFGNPSGLINGCLPSFPSTITVA